MELPTTPREPKLISPGTLLIYSTPKAGKTTIVSQLENHLLIEHEPRGADFVKANVIEIDRPSQLMELFKTIEEGGKPYKYLIVDTVTKWDKWSEIVGTFNYMEKPQGVRFNRTDSGKKIPYTHKAFETVHDIPNGYGYKHSRAVMIDWFNKITDLADHIIFLAHVKDKLIESVNSGDTVEAMDINLTGQVKNIYTANVDAVAHFFRKEGKGYLNFDNENSFTCGGRCKHLNGEIVISERQEDGSIKTFWDKIYLPNN